MADREKVKLGLECCHLAHLDCDNCPYDIENDSSTAAMGRMLYEEAGIDGDWADEYCMICLHHDALELLKAPEPRLLTLDEINALPDHTVLWQEARIDLSAWELNPLKEFGVEYEIAPVEKLGTVISDTSGTTVIDDDLLTASDGVQLRFWSARPTDEQRKAVNWDG